MSDAPAPPSGPAGARPEGASEPMLRDAEPMSLRRRTATVLAVVVAVFIAGLWIYALWIPKDTTPPGTLDDPTFAQQAQGICTDAAAEIAALPPAYQTPDAAERGRIITEADASLDTMLGRLAVIAPAANSGNDGRMVQEWLGDWRTYLGDRERYASALEEDPDARLYVTEKAGQQITEPIDFFAKYNDMPNCMTPGDLA
jgi:hypothetical protein